MSKNSKTSNHRFRHFALAVWHVLMIVTVLLGALYAFHFMHNTRQGEHYFRLRQIVFSGIQHVDQPSLEKMIRNILPPNLLLADLDRVRALVESESWVRSAHVRRRLPGDLFIAIEEREAVALAAVDNELFVVDGEGVMLDRYGPRYQAIDSPIVKGLNNTARENTRQQNAERMQVYMRILEAFRAPGQDYSRKISEVDVRNLEQVAVIPNDEPVPILLGDTDFRKRYEVFLSQKDLYYKLKEQYGLIESVDVSFDNKIIFHTPEEKSKTVKSVKFGVDG